MTEYERYEKLMCDTIKHKMRMEEAIALAHGNISSELINSEIFQEIKDRADIYNNKIVTNYKSNNLPNGLYNNSRNFGQNNENENINTNNNHSSFDYVMAILIIIGGVLLTIITFGGIFWGPWLFKKIFSCCYDFEDTVVPTNETDNQKSSNQNPMPNQDNNLEENLNKGEDKPIIK